MWSNCLILVTFADYPTSDCSPVLVTRLKFCLQLICIFDISTLGKKVPWASIA